jgi:luciferase family oxidoreductase group 1
VLEALAPGRIDMGVGRAPGSDRLTAHALNPHDAGQAEDFPRQVRDLQAWTAGAELPEDHPYRQISAHPKGPYAPDLWMLGSSDYGAQLAAHFGLPYAFAYFFSDGYGVDQALELYRAHFRPSPRYPKPKATICVFALAADTTEEAEYLALSRQLWRIRFEKGEIVPLAPPAEAATYPYTPAEQSRIIAMRKRACVGNPAEVAAKLNDLATRLELDELVIVTWTYDPAARRRSFELLAREFGLDG